MSRPSSRTAARATGVLLAVQVVFQAGLAGGTPWGRFAYGGQHEGRLPVRFRRASAVAAAVYAVTAIVVVSEAGPDRLRRPPLGGLAAFTAFGTGLNGISRSRGEQLLWTPYCAVTAVLAWRARPTAHGTRATSVITGGR